MPRGANTLCQVLVSAVGPVSRIIAFGRGLVSGIVKFVKDAILRPLAKLAEGTRGYDLLKAVLGQDPIMGEADK